MKHNHKNTPFSGEPQASSPSTPLVRDSHLTLVRDSYLAPTSAGIPSRVPLSLPLRERVGVRVTPLSTFNFQLSTLLLLLLTQAQGPANAPPAANASASFTHLDIYVDSGPHPLAAYQFELKVKHGLAIIVGIEGGEHPAYAEPPYYDPKALHGGRIIIAAFNTGNDLPTGKTRVARVMLQTTGDEPPEYALRLDVSATADGNRIEGKISHEGGAAE